MFVSKKIFKLKFKWNSRKNPMKKKILFNSYKIYWNVWCEVINGKKRNDHKLVLTRWSKMETIRVKLSNGFDDDWTVNQAKGDASAVLAVLTLLLLVWFFFLTSSSALLISSKVTPCVERLVSRTRFACALRCVSLSSSRAGGTNDLILLRDRKKWKKIEEKRFYSRSS